MHWQTRLFLLSAFSLALGHMIEQTMIGPRPIPTYFVENHCDGLISGHDDKQFYLRRKFYLTQPATRAWLKILGRDQVRLYVNGQMVEQKSRDGFDVAIMIDITPMLHAGDNLIAVSTQQHTIGQRPIVSIEGEYQLDDGVHIIGADDRWRSSIRFQRRGPVWWFQPDFDDRQWEFAVLTPVHLRASVSSPPRAVTEPCIAAWITPAALSNRKARVRRDFVLDAKPNAAWLRVTSTSCYRLAVNGIPIDIQEDQVGTPLPVPRVQRTYDLSKLMVAGRNSVALVLTATIGQPRILADFEASGLPSGDFRFGTDDEWKSAPGFVGDWISGLPHASEEWHACTVESGFMGVPPWIPNRLTGAVSYPPSVIVRRDVETCAIIFVVFAVTWFFIQFVSVYLGFGGWGDPLGKTTVLYVSLLPATLVIAIAVLATYDPRVSTEQIYNPRWVWMAGLSVPIQWFGLVATKFFGEWKRVRFIKCWEFVTWLCLLALMVTGAWLRLRNIDVEPLHPDEWFVYEAAQGILKCGFPITTVHKDLPTSYVSTSEILYYGNALVSLFTTNEVLIVRFPPVCFAMLTTFLLHLMGCRMGGKAVGLTAATFYTFSHFAVQMANFGRYYSQLQFFALLTVYFYWLTLRGIGPIHRRALWCATSSFIVTFLTWEASAIMAPGMMLAALVYRRTRIRSVLCSPSVWTAIGVVLSVILVQFTHRTIQQVERPWYGTGMSDAQLTPMWRYQIFDPLQYFWESSWNPDSIIPAIGFLSAVAIGTRNRFCKFILIVHVTTLLALGTLLPLDLNRYAYWQVPFMILVASNGICNVVHKLTTLSLVRSTPGLWLWYSHVLRGCALLTVVLAGSGMTLRLEEMPQFGTRGYNINQLKFPHTLQAVDYLRAHHREGDIVMATIPHVVDFYWKDHRTDFWPQTKLHLQAVLDDRRTLPLHKICGTELIPDLEALKTVFEKYDRIWFVIVPMWHSEDNLPEVSSFLLRNMEVAYEDFETLVLFRDKTHLPATQQIDSHQKLNDSKANFLP